MEKFWKHALAAAGVCAIGFFVFMSLYKEWLELSIFSKLTQDQTFILMILFLIIVFFSLLYAGFVHLKQRTKSGGDDEEWLIYQAAFLWHGISPPGIRDHFEEMTPEIQKTKTMLHDAVNAGQLKSSREVQSSNGVTRWVKKSELKKYAKLINAEPNFLKE